MSRKIQCPGIYITVPVGPLSSSDSIRGTRANHRTQVRIGGVFFPETRTLNIVGFTLDGIFGYSSCLLEK